MPSLKTAPPPGEARPRRTARASSARRQDILDAALGVLNSTGGAGRMIDLVAERCGLDRASIYYYVGSREELIFSAYQRSYDRLGGHLDAARGAGASALGQLERLALAVVRSPTPTASLSEIGLLTAEHRAAIEARRETFYRRLVDLVRVGAADGAMHPYDPALAARALEGALVLGAQWVLLQDAAAREGLAYGFVDVLLHGRRPEGAPFEAGYARPRIDVASLHGAWGDASCSDHKREAMLRVATRLINQRGVNGMTLDDMVGALGVTKGAFYHYFDSKDDLILRCYTRSQTITERYITLVQDEGGTGLERLQRASYHNFAVQLSEAGPLTLFTGFGALPEAMRELVRSRAMVGSAAVREMAYVGMEDGSCRRYPVAVGQRVFAGASAWLPTWCERGGLSVKAIADTFIPLYTNGLKRRPSPSPLAGEGGARAVRAAWEGEGSHRS